VTDSGHGANGERDLVRRLGAEVAALAREPRMEAIRQRWKDVNALRRPDRAPVWCRPVGCWREILPEESLVCRTPWLRDLERSFRQCLYKRSVDDDTVIEEWIEVPAVFRPEPANTWGVDIKRRQAGPDGGAWGYDAPIKTDADFDRLRIPRFRLDRVASGERFERTAEALDGILDVRLTARAPLTPTLGYTAADLRGLNEMMLDMAAEPQRMHRLMALIRDANLAAMDTVEGSGLLGPNNSGAMTCSDPVGPPAAEGRVTFRNLWCMANSQEFDAVSPAMWEEFCLEYQKPIFARYGLVGYGCCEDLTHKIDGVLSIPNLRIFTCSAWTDLGVVLDKVGAGYCIMWRQKASDVVFAENVDRVREDLVEGARCLRGRPHQIVLRELETLAGHSDRLHDWVRLAKAAAFRYA